METFILWAALGLLVLLLICGTPFYVAFGACAVPVLIWVSNVRGITIGQLAVDSVNSFILVAVPLFVLMGNTMARSGAAGALFDISRAFIGGSRASIGMSAVVACALFGTMCGSGVATALAVGTVVVPEMKRSGFQLPVAAAICGTAGTLGLMIPPSIAFIILGDVIGCSVGALFIAGIIPGILIAILLCIACYFDLRKRSEIKIEPKWSWQQKKHAIYRALPAALMPISIIGSIYAGICTPTEAAGVGCFVALIVGRFFYKGLTWEALRWSLIDTMRSCGAILCIVIGAVIIGRVFSFMKVPQAAGLWFEGLGLTKATFMWAFLALFFVLGMVFDAFVLQFVCLPILLPAIKFAGVDPIHLGILFTAIIMVGQITPPVGITLYASATGAGAGAGATIKASIPYMIAMAIGMVVIAFFPQLIVY